MLRIALTDDHTLFRKSLSLLVNSFSGMQVVAEAANGKELLKKLELQDIDILLLDLQMPEMDGFETSQKVIKLYPNIKILILTLDQDKETIKKLMDFGIDGYFTKNTDPKELKNAIEKLNLNGFYFEKKLTSVIENILENTSAVKTDQPLIVFTEREMEILLLIIKEYNGTEIGHLLKISPRTVEKHKRNLMEKTTSKNFIGVIIYAFVNGFLSINELNI